MAECLLRAADERRRAEREHRKPDPAKFGHLFTSTMTRPSGPDFWGRPAVVGEPVAICSWCCREKP